MILQPTQSSSRVDYGQTNSYGTSTEEKDITTKVTNHIVFLPNLSTCTTYHYRVYSQNGSGLSSLSTDNTFKTVGCPTPYTGSSGGGGVIYSLFPGIKKVVDPVVKPTIPTNLTTEKEEKVSYTFKFTTSLEIGSKGNEVKELQKILVKKGYLKVTPNGVFGPATKAALIKFQKAKKITPASGIFGPKTKLIINK